MMPLIVGYRTLSLLLVVAVLPVLPRHAPCGAGGVVFRTHLV